MGERDTAEGMALDAALMPLITSVNIACGGHAGSGILCAGRPLSRSNTGWPWGLIRVCRTGKPSDARSALSRPTKSALVSEQVMVCGRVLKTEGFTLRHVKPHGALYTMAARDEEIAEPLFQPCATLTASFCCMPWPGSMLARAGKAAGLKIIQEGFVDRAYRADGRLVSRSDTGAVIEDTDGVREQLRRLLNETVMTGRVWLIPMSIHSLCLHSDTPQALVLARVIRRASTEWDR